MKIRIAFFCLACAFSPAMLACPIGMVFDGGGCSPPYFYSGHDWLRDQWDAIESIGSNRHRDIGIVRSPEELARLESLRLKVEEEEKIKREAFDKGIWNVDSTPTPEGNLCVATFAKYSSSIDDDVTAGGAVTIMGFQNPKPDAWLMFQGTGLPKPRNVEKMRITLQQDDEPAQTVQAFNYRETRHVSTIAFAVPGLTAMLDGMSDKQRFRVSDGGKLLLDIEWHSAAPIIEQLRQCAQ